MRRLVPIVALLLGVQTGCAMLPAWKRIPAPGGCDQCHSVSIAANWQVSYQAAAISDERGQLPFQSPHYNVPPARRDVPPRLEMRRSEQACFNCHAAPTPAHTGRTGHYQHQ